GRIGLEGDWMKRKWPWLFGAAVVAAVVAVAGVLPADGGDFLWGLSIGLGVGAVFSWFAERGA
ncbi:MAG: hypothetical protein NDJ92_20690, partial [Thermoanaerobaculia bacterium]|nr:hypothetical protein [Thermoanaerobaculia bacterium]